MWAISGTRGSSGFGSVKREHIDNSTYNPEQCLVNVDDLMKTPWQQIFENQLAKSQQEVTAQKIATFMQGIFNIIMLFISQCPCKSGFMSLKR